MDVVNTRCSGVPAPDLGLAGDDQARNGRLARGLRDLYDDLAPQRLCVELALAGDDEIRVADAFLQAHGLGNRSESGRNGRSQRQQPEAQAAGSACPGPVSQARHADPGLDHIGPTAQRVVEVEHRRTVSAFLRAIDGAGAVRPEQWVVDVGSGHE